MTRLKETDEVEKAKPTGRVLRLHERISGKGKHTEFFRRRRIPLAAYGTKKETTARTTKEEPPPKYKDRSRKEFPQMFVKSLSAWDEAVEKAKGLIPGGSKRMLRRVSRASDRAERKAFAPNTAWTDKHLARRDKLDEIGGYLAERLARRRKK